MSEKDLIISEATYQGYPVEALEIDRKPGVTGDYGYVDLDLEFAKEIFVRPDFRLWQAWNRPEPAGPFSLFVESTLSTPTITDEPDVRPVKGFLRGGPLAMKSTDGNGPIGEPIRLNPIFLAPGSFDEIEADLEKAIEHKEGRLRLNVTDIRHFWQRNGTPVFGRYNMTLPNGKPDKSTVDPVTEELVPAFRFFRYLCRCLPGSPALSKDSDVFNEKDFRPPVKVDMTMQLPVFWMARLLEAYDLELHLSHLSEVVLKKRGRQHQVRRFRSVPGERPKPLPAPVLPDNPVEEKRVDYVLDRPEGVTVVGDRRRRRYVLVCSPAFIDENGRPRLMKDLDKLWGYSIEKAQEQALLGAEKAYENIQGADSEQHFTRVQIARKYFFKLYIPNTLFVTPPFAEVEGGPVSDYWPDDLAPHPWLPMEEPWWLPEELKKMPDVKREDPKTPVNAGNEGLIETGIVVRANILDQRHVLDLKAVKRLIDTLLDRQRGLKVRLTVLRDQKKVESERFTKLLKPDEFKEFGPFADIAAFIAKARDLLVETLGITVSDSVRRVHDFEAKNRLIRRIDDSLLRFEVRSVEEELLLVEKEIEKIKENREALERDLKDYGFAKLWINVPWGTVEQSRYSIQKEKGFIQFDDVVGVMEVPGTYDPELTKLISPGHVEVTYEAEQKLGAPDEMTFFTFMAPLPGRETEGPSIVRVSEPSTLKPTVIEDKDLVIHEDEFGNALNVQTVSEKASRLARSILDQPTKQTGYAYKYPGFQKVVTDDSVNQVSWSFEEGEAFTSILANNPDMDAGHESLSRKKTSEELLYGKKLRPR